MSEDIFKKAAKLKATFPYKGLAKVEDLFDLSVENLDTVYQSLSRELRETEADSLLASSKNSKARELLTLKIAVVKEIVQDKLVAADEALRAQEKAATKQLILSKLAAKKESALDNMSEAELTEMLNKL